MFNYSIPKRSGSLKCPSCGNPIGMKHRVNKFYCLWVRFLRLWTSKPRTSVWSEAIVSETVTQQVMNTEINNQAKRIWRVKFQGSYWTARSAVPVTLGALKIQLALPLLLHFWRDATSIL
jgi:hypothetical protein